MLIARILLLIVFILNLVSLVLPTWARETTQGGDIFLSHQISTMESGLIALYLYIPIGLVGLVIFDLFFSVMKVKFQNVKWDIGFGVFSVLTALAMSVIWWILHFPPWIIQDPQAGESTRLKWGIGIGLMVQLASIIIVLAQGVLVLFSVSLYFKKIENDDRLLAKNDSPHREELKMDIMEVIILLLTLIGSIIFVAFLSFSTFETCYLEDVDQLTLPEGFHVDIYADDVPKARQMALSPTGILYVGSMRFTSSNDTGSNAVYALLDTNKDGKIDKKIILLSGLLLPSGVTLSPNGDLFVAAVKTIFRFPAIDSQVAANKTEFTYHVVTDQLPDRIHHGWKYLKFGPDGLLYVPIGAPCNICEREKPFFTILTLNISSDGQLIPPANSTYPWTDYANGVRNSVGFDFHPVTNDFWFTDNGRDWLSDFLPHDELNRAPTRGIDFGFPFCYDMNSPDPDFNDGHNCDSFTPPVQLLDPHAAALGMTFYTGNMFPEEYHNAIFIAEHGSWNSGVPRGYAVSVVFLDETGLKASNYTQLLSGFIKKGSHVACGRPSDVMMMPDGSLLVSDDHANKIYRITYKQ